MFMPKRNFEGVLGDIKEKHSILQFAPGILPGLYFLICINMW
jgi:hypothetical protein